MGKEREELGERRDIFVVDREGAESRSDGSIEIPFAVAGDAGGVPEAELGQPLHSSKRCAIH